jgi:hypothetical protein
MRVYNGAHEYLGTRGVGRGGRLNSKVWRGLRPIGTARLTALLEATEEPMDEEEQMDEEPSDVPDGFAELDDEGCAHGQHCRVCRPRGVPCCNCGQGVN